MENAARDIDISINFKNFGVKMIVVWDFGGKDNA